MKHRMLRVNEVIKRELSGIVTREISFEGSLVSINHVDVTSDLKSAHVFVSVLGPEGGQNVMKKLEETEHSQGNFRFAAIAMVPPLTPFFPAAYHTGFGHQFAIALESANVVAAAFKDAPDLGAAKQRLTDSLAASAFDIERHAGRIDQDVTRGIAFSHFGRTTVQ